VHARCEPSATRVQKLAPMLQPFDGFVSNNVLPALKLLQGDADADVAYYAAQALRHYTE
jgi:hypothetical protein